MIRMVRVVALLTALTFGAVAGPVGAAATPRAHSAIRPSTTASPDNPGIVGELLLGVLAPLAPVVEVVLTGFDKAFTTSGATVIRLFVPSK